MENILLKPQPGEPAPRQVHAQFFQQLPLTGDAVDIPQQQDPQQHFRINPRSPRFAVGCTQLLTHKIETDVAIDQAQQVVFRNLIFDAEVVEQRLRTVVLPQHKQPTSENGDCLQHHYLSSAYNLAVVAVASTNSVTFSTPTRFYDNNPRSPLLPWPGYTSNPSARLTSLGAHHGRLLKSVTSCRHRRELMYY